MFLIFLSHAKVICLIQPARLTFTHAQVCSMLNGGWRGAWGRGVWGRGTPPGLVACTLALLFLSNGIWACPLTFLTPAFISSATTWQLY